MARDLVSCDGCGTVVSQKEMLGSWLYAGAHKKAEPSLWGLTFEQPDDVDVPVSPHRVFRGDFCTPMCLLNYVQAYINVGVGV